MAAKKSVTWDEVLPEPDRVPEVDQALNLLKQTLPNRYNYEQLDLTKTLRKMGLRDYGNGTWVRGLRIFQRVVTPGKLPVIDATVYFFLRLADKNSGLASAYCVTIGAIGGLPTPTLYSEVRQVCQRMQGEPGGGRLEVMNEFELPDDLPQLPGAQVVAAVFRKAELAGDFVGQSTEIEPNRAVWKYGAGRKMLSYLIKNPL